MVLTFESVDETFVVTIQVKLLRQYFRNVLYVAFYQMKSHQRKKSSTLRMIKVSASNLLLAWGRGVRIGKEKQPEVASNGKRYR